MLLVVAPKTKINIFEIPFKNNLINKCKTNNNLRKVLCASFFLYQYYYKKIKLISLVFTKIYEALAFIMSYQEKNTVEFLRISFRLSIIVFHDIVFELQTKKINKLQVQMTKIINENFSFEYIFVLCLEVFMCKFYASRLLQKEQV